mgnify:CR=1 FL=1
MLMAGAGTEWEELQEDSGYCYDGFAFAHATKGFIIPEWWVLLDNQSTVNLVMNKKLLTNIRKAKHSMRVACNAGMVHTDLIGDMAGYPEPVWYHPDGIANILSVHMVEEHGYDVQYKWVDGYKDKVYDVEKKDGSARRFIRSKMGLSYMDITNPTVHLIPAPKAVQEEAPGVAKEESPGMPQLEGPTVVDAASPGVAQQKSPGVPSAKKEPESPGLASAQEDPLVEQEGLALIHTVEDKKSKY